MVYRGSLVSSLSLFICFVITRQVNAIELTDASPVRSELIEVAFNMTNTAFAGCSSPFVSVGDKCLYFSHAEENQEDSRRYCWSLGGDLASIHTATQMKSVVNFINENAITGRNYWIDGSDADVEDYWLYSSGIPLPMGTPFWTATPGAQQPDGYPDENCLHLSYEFFYLMNDIGCYNVYSPICEETAHLSGTSVGKPSISIECPPLYTDVGGVCLAFLLWDSAPWVDVRQICQNISGELASINDIELLRSIYLYLHDTGIASYSFWLGGSDRAEEGVWTWLDGSPVPKGQPFWGVNRYYVSEPDGGFDKNCLALTAYGYHYFRDEDCGFYLNPICVLAL